MDCNLLETTLGRIEHHHYEVAVIPTGATEAHNGHLPEGQDVLHTTELARRVGAAAWERGAGVIVLPTIPFGVDCNLLEFPLTIHVAQATLDAMIGDVVRSLRRHGIRKVVILNGHGGNDFVPLVRQMQSDLATHLFICNWWTVGMDKYGDIFDKPDDHAGEMETSVALELFPQWVEMERAGDGLARPWRFEALEKGWVRTSRRFASLSDQCAVGEPGAASAAKGRRYLELVTGRIADFLVELAAAPIDERFPHQP